MAKRTNEQANEKASKKASERASKQASEEEDASCPTAADKKQQKADEQQKRKRSSQNTLAHKRLEVFTPRQMWIEVITKTNRSQSEWLLMLSNHIELLAYYEVG